MGSEAPAPAAAEPAALQPTPPKKLKHGKRRVKRRNLTATERLQEADRERENQRLARSLAKAAPAIDNHNEVSRAFQLKLERDSVRYTTGDRPQTPPGNRNPLDAVQARETAELPDVRASLELPAGPPSSVIRPDDERKEAEREQLHQQQVEAARAEAERVAAAKLERARERAEQRAAAKEVKKAREELERELAKRRVLERSEERKQAEEERAVRRKEVEEERYYQAQALKATLQSKTEVRGERLAEDRATVLHRKAMGQEERERSLAAKAEAERVRRMTAQTERASRRALFEGAKSDKDLTPSGPSSTVVSRAAARAVAKAVRDAELRAHEEMVAAHRQRLKESGAPIMRGGRISSTPRPGKGVTDWSRSQSERGHARSGRGEAARATDAVAAQTARAAAGGAAGWENDAAAVARLSALADTLSGNEPAEGVHDALAAELQRHGPLPPGVLSGLLGKGDTHDGYLAGSAAAAAKKTGTWPTSTPRGHYTAGTTARDGDPPPAIAALLERAAAGSLTEEDLTELELSSTERLPSGWLRQIRMTIRQQRFTTGGGKSSGTGTAAGGGSASTSGDGGGGGGGGVASGKKGRAPRLAVPRLRGPIQPIQPAPRRHAEDTTDYGQSPREQQNRGQIGAIPASRDQRGADAALRKLTQEAR